jgi:hypothetical protein
MIPAGNRFRERGNAEHRVFAHGLFAFQILVADRLETGHLAMTGNDRHDSGGLVRIDILFHPCGNGRHSDRAHARCFGIRMCDIQMIGGETDKGTAKEKKRRSKIHSLTAYRRQR